MKYYFTKDKQDYSDYSSGKVLYNSPGAPVFPVRAISEIFQYCIDYLRNNMIFNKEKISLFDPCCGSAYHLAVLGFLHSENIDRILCSDIDENILQTAKKNLSLLSSAGIKKRISEIETMIRQYNKQSHIDALESAIKLKDLLEYCDNAVHLKCFKANVLERNVFNCFIKERIDIIFADVPYENSVSWFEKSVDNNEIWCLLENISTLVNQNSLIVIASTKYQTVEHEKYIRLKKMKLGKRKISIFKLCELS